MSAPIVIEKDWVLDGVTITDKTVITASGITITQTVKK